MKVTDEKVIYRKVIHDKVVYREVICSKVILWRFISINFFHGKVTDKKVVHV